MGLVNEYSCGQGFAFHLFLFELACVLRGKWPGRYFPKDFSNELSMQASTLNTQNVDCLNTELRVGFVS